MSSTSADLMTLAGLVLTLIGAGVTAYAVILREEDAINIGVSRIMYDTLEENLKVPMVRNLLWSSRAAKWGLSMVSAGTVFQSIPVFLRLVQ